MRGKFSAVVGSLRKEVMLVLGFWQTRRNCCFFLDFRGLFCICSLILGTFLLAEGGRGWERRAGDASSGCSLSCFRSCWSSPLTQGVTLGTLCFGGSSLPVASSIWAALHQLQQQPQGPHSLQSWQ